MAEVDFFDKIHDCCCINILKYSLTELSAWSTFHGHSWDCSIL